MVIFSLLLGLVGAVVFLTICRAISETESQALAVGLVIAALIYLGFAVLGEASASWIVVEGVGVGIYSLLAVLGLRYSNWWLMMGWLLHPVWDVWLHFLEQGASFTPAWYALSCMSFDLLVAVYICGVQFGLFQLKATEVTNHFGKDQLPANFKTKPKDPGTSI